MNNKQALSKARKLWGKKAAVEQTKHARYGKNGGLLSGTHKVGEIWDAIPGFSMFEVKGDGLNWSEAFNQASERTKK